VPDIIITEFMDEAAVATLAARYDTHYDPALVDDPVALAALLAEARVLIVRNRTQVRGALLDAAPKLSAVGRLGVGLDNIDVADCERRCVTVYPATGANDASVAEYVLTAALVLLRGAWAASGEVAAGTWPRQALIGREIGGRRLGLVGFGSIARETAKRAAALGMEVVAHDPFVPEGDSAWSLAQSVSLDTLYESADVISLHVPLTDGTRHMINAERLAQMRSDAVLINAARGGVVDEAALAAAVAAGELAGAALDVFEVEPLSAEAGAKFAGLNVLLTPHIAGVTEESNVRVSALIAERVLAHLGG